MKEYSAWFYQSTAWRACRKAYLETQQYICERCGGIAKIVHHKINISPKNIYDTNITLSFSNLEAVCQDCHNKEPHDYKKAKEMKEVRYSYDSEGKVVYPP